MCFKEFCPQNKIAAFRVLFSTLIIPIPNSEVNFYYNSCEIKISQNGLLKINGKTKEIVFECIDFFENIILKNLDTKKKIETFTTDLFKLKYYLYFLTPPEKKKIL